MGNTQKQRNKVKNSWPKKRSVARNMPISQCDQPPPRKFHHGFRGGDGGEKDSDSDFSIRAILAIRGSILFIGQDRHMSALIVGDF
jgi:hypothetical protein